jgi:hypothetical protein
LVQAGGEQLLARLAILRRTQHLDAAGTAGGITHRGAARPTVQRARGFDADGRAFVFNENGERCRLREGIKRLNSAR